ncbi:MAG: hypothetical protein PHZ13_11845 [bacterium]|nr:hypothetical protein [bacterium]MDD4460511.1 hypothetical protein [Proteiniphilum sp.]
MAANTPATRKAKGREFQKYVAECLQESLGLPPEDVVSRPMGSPGLDIMLSENARDRFPYGVECKRTEKLSIPAWWKQCSANAKVEKLNPMLIYRRSHEEAMLVMRWDDFLEVVRKNE